MGAKANQYAEDMRTIAEELKPKFDLTGNKPNHSLEIFVKSFERYPTRDEVSALMEEIKQTKARRDELVKKLREMGIEPKE